MSGVRGSDLIAFYAADMGPTIELACTAVSVDTPDDGGPLVPGRYLLHLGDVDPALTTKIWVAQGPFVKGTPLVAVAGVPLLPFQTTRLIAFELNVFKGHNDRIAAIAAGAGTPTGTLYISRISRGA